MSVELPVKGEYGVEVYGNDPAKDGDTYTHICQYYIHYATANEQQGAFYQESPERRSLPAGQQAISKPANYNAAPAGVSIQETIVNKSIVCILSLKCAQDIFTKYWMVQQYSLSDTHALFSELYI